MLVASFRLINESRIYPSVSDESKTNALPTRTTMAKLVGYARVSTDDQDVELQLDALRKAGCRDKLIFIDKASGARSKRPGLESCLSALEAGDTLLVWRLDRLGRSMPHLVALIQELLSKGVAFRSLCDGAIDTTSASGELIFHIFSALAQFERRLIQERTKAGLSAARTRGRKGGRKPITGDDPRVKTAQEMHMDHALSVLQICKTLDISRATFYRYLAVTEDQSPLA
jgi:DNA invertase Pin-like site-specific DNA recombinase